LILWTKQSVLNEQALYLQIPVKKLKIGFKKESSSELITMGKVVN